MKVHLQAGSRDCVTHDYANETLFVTVLRSPIDRYASEYFYDGVNETLTTSKSTKEKMIEWYNRSLHDGAHIRMDKVRSNFIENWQTRWYTNPGHCKDLDRPPPHDSHPTYSYWKSGQRDDPRQLMTTKDLEDAKRVIDTFDIVGVAPFFGGECDMTSWLKLAGSNKRRSNRPLQDERRRENENKPEEVEDVKTNISKYLADQIMFDMELFDFAAKLSNRRKAIACCVNQHLQS